MVKRLLCICLVFCLAGAVCFGAAANGLPFDKPGAPEDLSFVFSYPNDGNECIDVIYTVPDVLCRVASLSGEMQKKYYGGEFFCCMQFDWSVDSRDAFHYDESWDRAGDNYPRQIISGSFVEKSEVFWFVYPEAVERCAPGVAKQQKNGNTVYVFDFDDHQLYVRARFLIVDAESGGVTVSDWSKVCDVGADRGAKPSAVPSFGSERLELSKPYLDGETLSFELDCPGQLRKTARVLLSAYGAQLSIESQLRVDGGTWEYWSMSSGEAPYLLGKRQIDLPAGSAEHKVEFRCRLIGTDPTDGALIVTGWSDLLTVDHGRESIVGNDDPFDEKAEEQRQKEAEKEANKCTLCGFCPFHPFGICMFIWIGAALLIALFVFYAVRSSKKKKQRDAETKAREEASRKTDADKTESFINTDRIVLRKDTEPKTEEDKEKEQEEETGNED